MLVCFRILLELTDFSYVTEIELKLFLHRTSWNKRFTHETMTHPPSIPTQSPNSRATAKQRFVWRVFACRGAAAFSSQNRYNFSRSMSFHCITHSFLSPAAQCSLRYRRKSCFHHDVLYILLCNVQNRAPGIMKPFFTFRWMGSSFEADQTFLRRNQLFDWRFIFELCMWCMWCAHILSMLKLNRRIIFSKSYEGNCWTLDDSRCGTASH